MRVPLCLFSILTATALAQNPASDAGDRSATPRIQQDATTLILPSGSYDLGTIVDAGADFLGWNILTNPVDRAIHKFELQQQMSLDKGSAEEALCELFFSQGFVLVGQNPAQQLYELIALGGAKGVAAIQSGPFRSVADILAQPHLKQPVVTSISLHNVDAQTCQNTLRPFLSKPGGTPGISVSSMPPNSIMLQGMQHEVARAIAMIRELDGPLPEEAPNNAPRLEQLKAQIQKLQAQLEKLQKELQK